MKEFEEGFKQGLGGANGFVMFSTAISEYMRPIIGTTTVFINCLI